MNIHNVLISMSISINNVCAGITYVIHFHVYLTTTGTSMPMEGAVASALHSKSSRHSGSSGFGELPGWCREHAITRKN